MGDTTQSLQYSNDRPTAVTLVDKNGNALTSLGGGSGGTTNNNTTNNNTTNNNSNYNTTNNNTTNNASTGAVTLLDALSNPYGARNPLASKITDPYYADRIMQIAADGSITALSKDYLLTALQNAQMFTAVPGTATNGIIAGAASTQTAMSVFNPAASKKNVLIISIRPMYVSSTSTTVIAALHNISRVTTDPAFGGAVTPSNASIGGAASVCSVTYANSAQSVSGTVIDVVQTSSTAPYQLNNPKFCYWLPAGTANGIIFYCNMGAAATPLWTCVFKWLEF